MYIHFICFSGDDTEHLCAHSKSTPAQMPFVYVAADLTLFTFFQENSFIHRMH
jgi:hypothetical protein